MSAAEQDPRTEALASYRARLLEHRELEAKVKQLRLGLRSFEREFEKSENDIKALQSVGQIIGEVLKQLDNEKCKGFPNSVIVKASSGPRYVVGCRNRVDKSKLKQGARVSLVCNI